MTTAMITKARVKEFAERMNFEVIESVKYVSLRSKFEFSDGYKPSVMYLTTREAFLYLQGFSDGKYDDL